MQLLDYDPLTGMSVYTDWTPEGDLVVRHEGNPTAVLDYCHGIAVDEDITRKGIKKDMWKYATVPPEIWMKWRAELGVDIFSTDPGQKQAVFKLLNGDYSRFKTTYKRHEGR